MTTSTSLAATFSASSPSTVIVIESPLVMPKPIIERMLFALTGAPSPFAIVTVQFDAIAACENSDAGRA